ncbi:uncharacterized protein TNCV_3103961 [Trichonephila clavipes]|nr:uncharacterized protein TNCV_3103961 [Trichonephila clavipes]
MLLKKVAEEFISAIDSQFKELSEMLKCIVCPDVTLFDKLKLSQFCWLEIEEFDLQLIFGAVQYGFKNLLKQGKNWN